MELRDNEWEAEGFYATSASKGKGQQMTFAVPRQGDAVIIEFVASLQNPGKLKLLDHRHMDGTMNFVVTRKSTNRALKPEKVDNRSPKSKSSGWLLHEKYSQIFHIQF
jgi:hypothetical protein